MRLYKKLETGKVMTICLKCERVTHTYSNTCTCCGGFKNYHYFFEQDRHSRIELLKLFNEYHDKCDD